VVMTECMLRVRVRSRTATGRGCSCCEDGRLSACYRDTVSDTTHGREAIANNVRKWDTRLLVSS
jgi:hypothetical protein